MMVESVAKHPHVNLYGWNLDVEHLRDLLPDLDASEIIFAKRYLDECSPAVIATAAAGISHQNKEGGELRKHYRDLKELIGLDDRLVQMGHSSIIEHAYFNFDIVLTRLAIEFLEQHRFGSYTEKSQRFTRVDPDGFFFPKSLRTDKDQDRIARQIALYQEGLTKLTDRLKRLYGDDWKNHASSAKEDARFCLPLLAVAPTKFSVNGRELEYIIQKARSHELQEVRDFGDALERELAAKVPLMQHLIKYTQADPYYSRNGKLERTVQTLKVAPSILQDNIDIDPEMDDKIIAALIFRNRPDLPYSSCLKLARETNPDKRKEIVMNALEPMKSYQKPPREFEMADIEFSAVISASCYAQLKRHRELTLIPQQYTPNFGVTIPESIEEVELDQEYGALGGESSGRFKELQSEGNPDAPYILTNGHQRRVLVKMNARELYHFSRLRQDTHAQWQIRELADEVVGKVKEKAPLTTLLIGGKDKFDQVREQVYS